MALETPLPVSPGDAGETLQIGDRCPTFIWGWQPEVRFFELVVYRIEEDEQNSESRPVIRTRVQGSAAAWTPSLDSCLEDGRRYAWSLRATGETGASNWSPPRLFRVTAAPTEAEFERALAVVERFLRERGWQEAGVQPASTDLATATRWAERTVAEASTPQSAPAPASPSSSTGVGGAGIVVEGAVVETKAAAPCFPTSAAADSFDRYVDCGNGTVLDTVTGLLWLKQADCLGSADWWEAHAAAASLASGQCGLADHSQAADWRLPTRAEWQVTIGHAVAAGCTVAGPGDPPTLTSDPGSTCLAVGPTSFAGVQTSGYWSASTRDIDPETAWSASLDDGAVEASNKSQLRLVWAVRAGSSVSWATYR